MHLSDFDYDLPEDLIAQQPLAERTSSRLLVLDRESGRVAHRQFADLADLLRPGDLLVRNETRVIPARLLGEKVTGGQIEVLLVRQVEGEGHVWRCMTRSSKPVRAGMLLHFPGEISGHVLIEESDGCRIIRFECQGDFLAALEQFGKMPLPPYIRREADRNDHARYQTVFARESGAVAAPTAGLHFNDEMFSTLEARGIETCGLILHVGLGTFLPVRSENLDQHRMHGELYEIPAETAEKVNQAHLEGRRVIALGTTSTRALEDAVDENGRLRPGKGMSELFIRPGFRFRVVDGLITNFHLPKSTLLMLVSAFAGRDNILAAYREAVERKYRFFSYGDCMFIG
ncbi:MAG: tRNA preQ1(34) S-adenosylmethionine ribosyltransferase-isomerase QueA [Desulfuromonadales bacterium]|nr:tRNA preQ1(34) S-adenosylmethionine ribosyltransferase-isomerase QueA [Desulfuromonadales bacterium]